MGCPMRRASRQHLPLAICCAFLAATCAFEAEAAVKKGKRTRDLEQSAEFFTEPGLRLFQLEVSEAALLQLRRAPRAYVTATVREGDHVLTNVAIRLKGMGSFRTVDEKPSLAVKFDELATNQTYRGLSKLMFNNTVQDSTGLAE